jgi:hypothetical protein
MTSRRVVLNVRLSRHLFVCAHHSVCSLENPEAVARTMHEPSPTPDDKIVPLPTMPRVAGETVADGAPFIAGGRDDPRTQEAIRLIESFLAIEDASARAALIALAESLVTHDWLRRTQQK